MWQADPRPSLDGPLAALLGDLCARLAPLAGIEAAEVLIVAASAHGTAAASVRSLDAQAARVEIKGQVRRWELALRPPFFLGGDATRRLGTLVHELLHLDPFRPGALREEARHAVRSHQEHEAEARGLAEEWLAVGELSLLAPLGHHGEVKVRQWRHRPVPETNHRSFGDNDVFSGLVFIATPEDRRTVWW